MKKDYAIPPPAYPGLSRASWPQVVMEDHGGRDGDMTVILRPTEVALVTWRQGTNNWVCLSVN